MGITAGPELVALASWLAINTTLAFLEYVPSEGLDIHSYCSLGCNPIDSSGLGMLVAGLRSNGTLAKL